MSPAGGRSPARHDLAWLGPGWRDGSSEPLDRVVAEALSSWVERGLPAVVARRLPGDGDAVRLGVALSRDRLRASVVVARDAIARLAPPLTLAEVTPSAPGPWVPQLRALDRAARGAGLVLRVYGSLAWQHLSGEDRVDARSSDVDLLVRPRDAAQLREAVKVLRDHGAGAAPALDGEVLLPGGRAVAWRELASGARVVLVKTDSTLSLEPREEVLRAVEASC